MVWPFTPSADPLANLDPELRKFLDREAPKSQSIPKPTPQRQTTKQSQQEEAKPQLSPSTKEKPTVPSQSLFPDGRYAHLWKTYQPDTSPIHAKSDGEMIRELVDGFEWRKKEIAKVTQENCAFEALAENECWKTGTLRQKLWMCREETRALDRCTVLQTKFLQALGYLSEPGRDAAVEDKIQTHADKLYQQMLAHEQAVTDAKTQGLPPPEFKPVMSRENLAKVLGVKTPETLAMAEQAEKMAGRADLSHVPEDMRERYEKTVKDMTPDERLVEEAVQVSTAKDHSTLARNYQDFLEQRKQESQLRKEQGSQSVGDRVKGWFSTNSEEEK